MKRTLRLLTLAAILVCPAFGQDAPQTSTAPKPGVWIKTETADALHGTKGVNYRLYGEFLAKPNRTTLSAPVLDLYCEPGKHHRFNGKLSKGFVDVGAVLASKPDPLLGSSVDLQFRLDNGKLQRQPTGISTDLSAMSLLTSQLNTFLYGHFMPHKQNTNEQVHEIILGVNEYLAGEIQMRFDLPDVSEVADVCGVTEQ